MIRISACLGIVMALSHLTSGCTSIPVDQRERIRNEIIAAAEDALVAFTAEDPAITEEIEDSVGYVVITGSAAYFGLVGHVDSVGVLYDRTANSRTFLNVDEFNFGATIGAADVQALAIFNDDEALQSLKTGRWIPAADLVSVAGDAVAVATWVSTDTSLRVRTESGVAVGGNVSISRVSVNTELTDTGLTDAGIPNRDGPRSDRQGTDAPRVWGRKLPVFGQSVIDKGYDLPLPLGVGLTYIDIEQDIIMTELMVAFDGGDLERFEFVTFENSNTMTESYQLKLDAWLFPFLNVFGLYGKVDGSAVLDVFLDGNLMLDEIGTDCSGIILRPPLCDLLDDQIISFPVRAEVDIETYGFGTILAGGWKGWFAVIPATVTYAKPTNKVTDGFSLTVTPRVGRLVDMGNFGSLALFVGGNYLDSELTIDGSFTFPGENLTIDYRINQKNKDRWNIVTGFNWNITQRIGWSAEYNGFTGSREAFITSINVRY